MLGFEKVFNYFFQRFLSEKTKTKIEEIIVFIAIGSFVIHLTIIGLVDFGFLNLSDPTKLFTNPIAALYTPFSFILIYEVYLLIYYLPKSITIYIGKQYEIMTLILIRRIFKDLAALELTPNWFEVSGDLAFTYDIISTAILFFLIWLFYSLVVQKEASAQTKSSRFPGASQFIKLKNIIATILVPIFFSVAIYSLYNWIQSVIQAGPDNIESVTNLDSVFFDSFFTILILVDVFLLLISFLRTDRFSTVIRNSGFIISTILIKLSFGTDGILNNILIVVAVFYGVLILAIHNRYYKLPYNS